MGMFATKRDMVEVTYSCVQTDVFLANFLRTSESFNQYTKFDPLDETLLTTKFISWLKW